MINAGTGRLRPPVSTALVSRIKSVPLPEMSTQSKFSNVEYSSPPPSTQQSPLISRRSMPPASGRMLGMAQLSAAMEKA